MNIVLVVGNPKPGSRTLTVGRAVADQVGRMCATQHHVTTLDLVDIGHDLLNSKSATVLQALRTVQDADLLVVASPTYRGTYSGLLKLFFDQANSHEFRGRPAIPVMIGGDRRHALAVEVLLRPLLVEVGAVIPTRGLFVCESDLESLDQLVESWSREATAALTPHMFESPDSTAISDPRG